MGSGAGDQLQVGARVRPVLGVLDSLRSMLDELDPGQLPARDAMDLVTVLDRVGRVADAGKMTAALRVAESSLWNRKGDRSPAHWVASATGVGVGDAVRLLKTGEAVAEAPETGDAMARGDVSRRQADAIARDRCRASRTAPQGTTGRRPRHRRGRDGLGVLEAPTRRAHPVDGEAHRR